MISARSEDRFKSAAADRVPKLCGGDVELANFVRGLERPQNTASIASRLLLSKIPGLPRNASLRSQCDCATCRQQRQFAQGLKDNDTKEDSESVVSGNSQDVDRRFLLSNGSSVYIDLDHLEVCLPEILSAYQHVAATHGMLAIAQRALEAVNRELREGYKIQVLVNNSDGQGNSYGSHLNILTTRRAWNNIFHRKMHYMLHLASFQVASIVLTGQGKVGSENGAPPVPYQISQRADFFETLTGSQTTYHRPLVNSRDESLTGSRCSEDSPGQRLARLHCIFYDHNLCHVAGLLKAGLMQIETAMIEAEQVSPALLLDDPVEAVTRYSHDPTLTAKARLVSGKDVGAVDLARLFIEEMHGFAARGGCDGIVPRAKEILSLADDTLQKLAAGDFDALVGRLDWVLKGQILTRAIQRYPQFTWESPQVKHLDHLYSSLDPAEGLYLAHERSGLVERVASAEEIQRQIDEPPTDTRAYTRAMLLRRALPGQVRHVDWDRIEFRLQEPGTFWTANHTLKMDDPLSLTKAQTEHILADPEKSLHVILDELDELIATQSDVFISSAPEGADHSHLTNRFERRFIMLFRQHTADPVEQAARPIGGPPPGDQWAAHQQQAQRLLNAGDDAMDRALSVNSETFLRESEQTGGE